MANIAYIKVAINNEEVILEKGITVMKMLEDRGIKPRTAVWINGKQLLLSDYETQIIRERDVIKILRIVAGG